MGRTDGASRYNKRDDGISDTLKVLADALNDGLLTHLDFLVTLSRNVLVASHFNLMAGEYHREDSSNIFTNEPTGPNFSNEPQHLRPEVAVILRSKSLSGD